MMKALAAVSVLLFLQLYSVRADDIGTVCDPVKLRSTLRMSRSEAQKFVATYNGGTVSGCNWSAASNGIASGGKDWLQIYTLIRPFTDAATGEEITMDLAEAIKTSPEEVLQILKDTKEADDICAQTSIEVPLRQDLDALAKREQALSGVRSPDLETTKRACLKVVRHLSAKLKKTYSEKCVQKHEVSFQDECK